MCKHRSELTVELKARQIHARRSKPRQGMDRQEQGKASTNIMMCWISVAAKPRIFGPDLVHFGPDFVHYEPDLVHFGPDLVHFGPIWFTLGLIWFTLA